MSSAASAGMAKAHARGVLVGQLAAADCDIGGEHEANSLRAARGGVYQADLESINHRHPHLSIGFDWN